MVHTHKKGFCRRGHEKVGDNLIVAWGGIKKCRICTELPKVKRKEAVVRVREKGFCYKGHKKSRGENKCQTCLRLNRERRIKLKIPWGHGKKKFCKYGHEFTPENTRKKWGYGYVHRVCRKCAANDLKKRRYGLTQDEFLRLLEVQRNLCAICKKEMIKPCVDHCHNTNKVRGLLCGPCNWGLGGFKDNPTFLRNAASYIESFNALTRSQ